MLNTINPKITLNILFLLFLSSFSLTAAQETNSRKKQLTDAENKVLRLQREWLNAYEQRDDVAMERIVADDFTIAYPNGAIQRKPQIIAFLKTHKNSANSTAPKFTTTNVESRVYGDTVILIGRLITERIRNGQPVREFARYTDTYFKRNGRWQAVASHLSNIDEQENSK